MRLVPAAARRALRVAPGSLGRTVAVARRRPGIADGRRLRLVAGGELLLRAGHRRAVPRAGRRVADGCAWSFGRRDAGGLRRLARLRLRRLLAGVVAVRRVSVVGNSGSGKSTLSRALAGRRAPARLRFPAEIDACGVEIAEYRRGSGRRDGSLWMDAGPTPSVAATIR